MKREMGPPCPLAGVSRVMILGTGSILGCKGLPLKRLTAIGVGAALILTVVVSVVAHDPCCEDLVYRYDANGNGDGFDGVKFRNFRAYEVKR